MSEPTDKQVQQVSSIWRTDHHRVRVPETGQIRCVCGNGEPKETHRIRVILAAAERVGR